MMYGLCDGINFYASAEMVYDLNSRNKPLVVLTANDSYICALSNEAKALNIKKFEPYYKIKKYLAQEGVIVRSTNPELYSDISNKMMNVLSRFCDNQYVYSIDESFLLFNGYENVITDWAEYGQKIRRTVWKEVRVPVGVGFAKTITLCKAANHAAKRFKGYKGIAVIDSEVERTSILKKMKVSDVWGVGKKTAASLNAMGVFTALELARLPHKQARREFSISLEKTVLELNGNVCFKWDEVRLDKKEMHLTSSFGCGVVNKVDLASAITSHAVKLAHKLRLQNSLAKKIVVFASSSAYRDEQYSKAMVCELATPSSDTLILSEKVNELVEYIYKPGVTFTRSGVGVIHLLSGSNLQNELFNPIVDNEPLMICLDSINNKYGTGTLKLGSEKSLPKWKRKESWKSPSYTTRWKDIPIIKC